MDSWVEIERQYGPLVWKTANRLLNSNADAADCYQEVFLAALVESRRREIKNWPAFLRLLATQRGIDRLRQCSAHARRHEAIRDVSEIVGDYTGPEETARANELMEAVRKGLTTLPAKQAEVFWMRFVDQLTYEEIAEQLAINPNAVGVLIHRARAKLGVFLANKLPHSVNSNGRF
jgi:RNA polymerase sigma-70 factor (ECF subfamily)